MGWYSGNRREEVKRHIGPWDSVEGVRCGAIKHSAAGNEDWLLMEARRFDGTLVDTWISLTIWEDGMLRTRARRQAFESLNEVPLGRLTGILKRILPGDKGVIEAYRRCSDATRFGHKEEHQ